MENAQDQGPLARAMRSLRGLAVGDCLGERFFGRPDEVVKRIASREIPPGPWGYTDDTEMALSVYAALRDDQRTSQDRLAKAFASRMSRDRGYGRGAFEILWGIRSGGSWSQLSRGAFGGSGSYGNGAAMRVAPLGAYFADDIETCVAEARLQSEVTHSHPEGIAGAIAVAVATAIVWQDRKLPQEPAGFLESVLTHVPPGATREGIEAAVQLGQDATSEEASQKLGNGYEISAQDTVPFCLWVVSTALRGTYEEAFWRTVVALGDRDTTCAIVGGILGVRMDPPQVWVDSCEAYEP